MTRDEFFRRLKSAGIRVPPSGLLRSAQVELFYGFGHTTLQKWRDAGIGPKATRLGGHWHYDIDELLRYMSESEPDDD